jgi:cysteine desulfurase
VLYGPAVRYLDHNATTPLDPRVRDAVISVLCDDRLQANPSSVHGPGQRARAVVEQARRAVARAVGAAPLEVTFTSGGTEADNLAILGAARALRAAGRPAGVLTTSIEHPAVLAAARALAAEGPTSVQVSVDGHGRVDPERLAAQLRAHPDVGLVSLAAANHELGNAYDLPALVRAAREAAPGVLVHSDAVQAFGKISVDLHAWDLDLLSLSAHKIHGPKGVGALVHRRGLALAPVLHGGPQERGRRPGSESTALIAGFGVAAELAEREREARRAHTLALVERLRDGLERLPGVTIHGDRERCTGTTVNAGFAGCDGQLLLINLDLAGFAVATGAACASGSLEPSPVLLACGLDAAAARSALRISVGKDTTAADIDALLAALPELLGRVRGAAVDAAGWRELSDV